MRTADDVRRNPMPGDMAVIYQIMFYRAKGNGNIKFQAVLGLWRKWAKDAEVIHIAQEEGKV
jgi:prepilin signal peptidase PulO-like enzyme (type II secretory pathway)